MKFMNIASLALAVLLVSPVMADDAVKEKKKNAKGNRGAASPAMQLIKQLEPVGLTEEQTTKIKELAKASAAADKALREEAGLTPELMKKRAEAQKELKDSGKKGKEMAAAVNEASGATEAQAAAFAKLNESRMKFQRAAMALLTDEQKANVPEKLQRMLKAAGGEKAKGKKKKEAAAE
ncbi:MAG: hypothetical protein WBD20_22910 [Pirellulaceae bacterium]